MLVIGSIRPGPTLLAMIRILLAFLGMFLGAVHLTGSTPLLRGALAAHDLHATIQLFGEALFLSTQGAVGGMIGALAGFLVGWVLSLTPGLFREDCPRSCEDHFRSVDFPG